LLTLSLSLENKIDKWGKNGKYIRNDKRKT